MSHELIANLESTSVELSQHFHNLAFKDANYRKFHTRIKNHFSQLVDKKRKHEQKQEQQSPSLRPFTAPVFSQRVLTETSKKLNGPAPTIPTLKLPQPPGHPPPSPRLSKIRLINSTRASTPLIEVCHSPRHTARTLTTVRPFVPPLLRDRSISISSISSGSPRAPRSLLTVQRKRQVYRKLFIFINVLACFRYRGLVHQLRRENSQRHGGVLTRSIMQQIKRPQSALRKVTMKDLYESQSLTKSVLSRDLIFQAKKQKEQQIKQYRHEDGLLESSNVAQKYVNALRSQERPKTTRPSTSFGLNTTRSLVMDDLHFVQTPRTWRSTCISSFR
ncbi:hypothetical protein GEMRC1_002089 [Eukaryota sp. GEM-RC1]